MQANNGEHGGDGAEGVARIEEGVDKVRRRGFPRILKAGHGIKLGAVVGVLINRGSGS